MVSNPNDPDAAESQLMTNVFDRLDCAARCGYLSDVVLDAVTAFLLLPPPDGVPNVDLFVAPEYLFGKSSSEHFVDEETRDHVVTQLKALSEEHPNLVLIPGTVAWKKPANRGGGFLNFFKRNRLKKAKSRLKKAHELDLLNQGNRDRMLNKIEANKDDDDVTLYIGENTCYIMRNGEVLLKYRKRNDGGEVNPVDDTDVEKIIWSPGNKDSTFSTGGVDFGLEICAEFGALRRLDLNVDVQVAISASRAGVAAKHTREGGFVLHSDAVAEPTVYQRIDEVYQKIDADHQLARSPLEQDEVAERVDRGADMREGRTGTEPSGEFLRKQATQMSGRLYVYGLLLE